MEKASLRTVQYSELMMKGQLGKPMSKKKPMQMILGVLKSDADPNRSPLGSPPIEKKKLRRLSNPHSPNSTAHPKNTLSHAEEKENMSEEDLKQLQHSQPTPILKKNIRAGFVVQSHPTKCSHSRTVQFSGNVKVLYIGDTDSCLEPLNTADQDRHAFIVRNILRKSRSQDMCDSPPFDQSPLHIQSCSSTTKLPSFQDNPLYKPPVVTKTEQGKSVSISFSQNSRNITVMKFVVHMGPNYDPDNIVVKANMSGNRLRVVASQAHSEFESDMVKEQYNERFQLPMQVDPYKVEARLDSRGYLTVDAPLMTVDQRRVSEQKSGSISI